MAVFLLNEKPGVKTAIRISVVFLRSLSEQNVHNGLKRNEHQLWKDRIEETK